MDPVIQAFVIAIVQGITEPIPISSSGHLILVPWFLHWNDPFINSLEFSVVLHMGTLVAMVAYFWRDWARLIPAGLATIRDRSFAGEPDRRLAWAVAVTLPPAALAGYFLNDFFEEQVRQPLLVALTLTIGAGILWLADRLGRRERDLGSLGFGESFLVGCAQAVALIPGISRSGISISAGLGLGLTREAAARFSFLMGAPIIAGAGVLEIRKMLSGAGPTPNAGALLVGFATSLVVGLVAIDVLLRYVRGHSLNVFVAYRLVLAALVVVVFLGA